MLDKRKANRIETAEWFDVSAPTVDGWVRDGCPYVIKGSKGVPWQFDLRAVAEWHYGRKAKQPHEEHDSAFGNPDSLHPKDRRDWYEGERVREKVEELKANLVSRDEFDAEKERVFSVIAECLAMLPDKLTAACGLSPAASAVLRDLIDRERAVLAIDQ